MLKIIIGFSKPKNRIPIIGYIFSWLIRLFDRAPYSHVYVRWYSDWGGYHTIYEASPHDVNFRSKQIYFDKYVEPVCEYELEVTVETYKLIKKYCHENAGKKYGYLQIVGIALARIFKLKKNPFSNGRDRMPCSEMVGDLIVYSNIDRTEIDLELAGPSDIEKLIKNIPGINKLL